MTPPPAASPPCPRCGSTEEDLHVCPGPMPPLEDPSSKLQPPSHSGADYSKRALVSSRPDLPDLLGDAFAETEPSINYGERVKVAPLKLDERPVEVKSAELLARGKHTNISYTNNPQIYAKDIEPGERPSDESIAGGSGKKTEAWEARRDEAAEAWLKQNVTHLTDEELRYVVEQDKSLTFRTFKAGADWARVDRDAELKDEFANSNKFAQDQENKIERLKRELAHEERVGANLLNDLSAARIQRDQWKEQAEKLANALEYIARHEDCVGDPKARAEASLAEFKRFKKERG